MAFIHGKETIVLMEGIKMSDYLKSVEPSKSADTVETTVFNSSDVKSYIPGKVDATLSGDGLFDAQNIDNTLRTALGSSDSKVWCYWPDGTSTGKAGYGMDAYETTYDMNSPLEDVVSLSIGAQSKVGMDRIISLFNLSNIASSSGNGNNNDNSAASSDGGVGYIQRTDTGTRTLTPIIQHSSANVSWATLVSFTASTGKGAERIAVAAGSTIKRYLRFKYNISAGSTKAVTTNIGFYRK